jgi:hypothetical protein
MVVLHSMLGPGFLSSPYFHLIGGNHLTAISFDELAYLASAPAITLCSWLLHHVRRRAQAGRLAACRR